MKKVIAIFMVVSLCATVTFAIDLSAGGDFAFTNVWKTEKIKGGEKWSKETLSTNVLGFNGFFDAQYVRVGLGANFSVSDEKRKSVDSDGVITSVYDPKVSYANFRLSVLSKYPFTIGEVVKLYPLVGFEFDFNIYEKYDGEDVKKDAPKEYKKDLNHYYFVAGMGADIFVTGNLFLTPKATFGIDMKKPHYYKARKEIVSQTDSKYSENAFKFDFGIGVGYKF